jgi:hypothetical protein
VTTDAVSKLELLVELFERQASHEEDCVGPARQDESNSGFVPPAAASRAQTLILAEMLAGAPTLLDAVSRSLQSTNENMSDVVGRIARFLTEHAEIVDEDGPRSPRLLHYVYPIV